MSCDRNSSVTELHNLMLMHVDRGVAYHNKLQKNWWVQRVTL